MSLIASVSGIRGTIGGYSGDNLSPIDIVRFTSAYGRLIKGSKQKATVVLGRDGRISGEMVASLVLGSLQAMGINVIQTGLSTTPTVEMAVVFHKADGGIILTASHNPKEWNALKLLNAKGEFISSAEGLQIIEWSKQDSTHFSSIYELGQIQVDKNSIQQHVKSILELPFILVEQIRNSKFKVIVDCINSTGALAIPPLLDALNVDYQLLNSDINGDFAHNPEPLPENLSSLLEAAKNGFDLGIAVDPDVDRLAFVDDQGCYFGEEYTLVAVADYMLGIKPGNTVSNLSSSRALRDLTIARGGNHYTSSVGEVHVVNKMKEVNAIIGGEGNGGVILPDLHYGRDALVGIALILSNMASKKQSLRKLKTNYPMYEMHKDKIILKPEINYDELIKFLTSEYKNERVNLEDGLKIDFENSWVHLRKSNTEPIVRIYSEAKTQSDAMLLSEKIKDKIEHF
ncbi:MAG: phosphoglucosamine mutase [Saprospiraceae bacterium]